MKESGILPLKFFRLKKEKKGNNPRMPSIYTHFKAGRDVLSLLPPNISRKISLPSSYRLGCQGGDFGFFYPTKDGEKLNFGKRIHRSSFSPTVEKMKDACRKDPTLFSYCAGFLTHYCLDVRFHAEIAKAEEGRRFHASFERALDAFFKAEDGKERGIKKEKDPVGRKGATEEEWKKINSLVRLLTGEKKASVEKLKFSFAALEFSTKRLIPLYSVKFSPLRQKENERRFCALYEKGIEDSLKAIANFHAAVYEEGEIDYRHFLKDFSGKISKKTGIFS